MANYYIKVKLKGFNGYKQSILQTVTVECKCYFYLGVRSPLMYMYTYCMYILSISTHEANNNKYRR